MRSSHHGSCHLCCHHNYHHDRQQYQGKLIPELAGAIFMCNTETRKECFRCKLFGLPACREHFVRQVRQGMLLFLFDTDNRRMYGVFEATSNGDMNIVPDAYSSSGKTYPAQVQFAIKSACRPLTEPEFRSAILMNYFTDVKFEFDLNFDQVQRLLVLFEEKKVRRISQPITDKCFSRYSTSSPLDPIRNQNRSWYTVDANFSRYASDPAQQGFQSSSSHHLAQQQEQIGYCTGTGNCVVCSQKVLEVHDPDPPYPENNKITVGTYSKSQLRAQVYNNGSQDVEQRKSVFLRLARKWHREAWEEEPCQTVLHPTKNQPCDRADPDSDGMDGIVVDPTTAFSNLTAESCETQIPFVNFNRRNGGSKLSIEPKKDVKKRRLIRPSLELEDDKSQLQVGPMQVANHLSEPLKKLSLVGTKSALDGESMEETDIMHVEAQVNSKSLENLWGSIGKSEENQPELKLVGTLHEGFQGHSEGERALLGAIGIETGRGKFDQDTSLTADSSTPTFGQCRADINEIMVFIESESNKLKQHFDESKGPLFRSDSCLDKIPDKFEVEVKHVFETRPDNPQIILVSCCQKTDASKLDEASATFSYCHPDSLVFGEKTNDNTSVSNHKPISLEPIIQIEDSSGFEGQPDNSKISICLHNEKSNQIEEVIAPDPKARDLKASPVSHINSKLVEEDLSLEPETNRLEMGFFSCQNSKPVEGEPDNSKIFMCLHNEESNLVGKCIAPEPRARDPKTSLVSHMEKSNLVKGDLTLEPEADRLDKGLFSCQNSKSVEDYIPLEPYDENSQETFEYLEIKDRYYITVE